MSANLVDVYLNWPSWFHFPILLGGPFVILIVGIDYLSSLLDVIRMSMQTVYSHS